MGLKNLLEILIILVIAFGLIIIYFRHVERRTIFQPIKEIEFFPKELGLDFEDVFFKTADGIDINGWFLPYAGAKYTVLFCHGNAGNISYRLENIKFFHDLGYNVFIFDYRGYGRSKGRPSEKGLYLDAQAAYDYLVSRKISPEQIIGFGKSLGGAVIIDLAYKNKLAALIISSAFSNGKDMAKIVYPFLPYWIFTSRFDSLNKIKSVSVPKLIIHSIDDEMIPYKLGEELYQGAAQPKEFLQIRGDHNSCFFISQEILKEKIADFIAGLPR